MNIKVLAIDDSATMRNLLYATLSGAGFDVRLAEDGAVGLQRLAEVVPDVIVTDINMPNLDGLGFIESVRRNQQKRALPILVLTTESGSELKERARKAGATGWIVKPFDESKLIGAIERVTAV
ncbi:MAG: response regulator [Roseovarius sp.]|nr:response regulator [Roseovarius sp.]